MRIRHISEGAPPHASVPAWPSCCSPTRRVPGTSSPGGTRSRPHGWPSALAGARAAAGDLVEREAREATAAELERVHPPEYLAALERVAERGALARPGHLGRTWLDASGAARRRRGLRGGDRRAGGPSARGVLRGPASRAPCERAAAHGLLPHERRRGGCTGRARAGSRAGVHPRLGRAPRQRDAGGVRRRSRGADDLVAPERPLAGDGRRGRARHGRRGGGDGQHHVPRRHRARGVPRALPRPRRCLRSSGTARSSCSCRAGSMPTATIRSPDSRSRTRRTERWRVPHARPAPASARRGPSCCSRGATTSRRSSTARARWSRPLQAERAGYPVRRSTMPRSMPAAAS